MQQMYKTQRDRGTMLQRLGKFSDKNSFLHFAAARV